ncbi:MAG: hypothetical protein NTY38_13345 [Acidobacteria bacterium]|nr:hypothetical protein [Acidobacteriota bacterium]
MSNSAELPGVEAPKRHPESEIVNWLAAVGATTHAGLTVISSSELKAIGRSCPEPGPVVIRTTMPRRLFSLA